MRHPFANVQYYASSLSVEDFTDSEHSLGVRPDALAPVKGPPILPAPSATSLVRNYSTKRSNEVTFLLAEHEGDTPSTAYRAGETIHGFLRIARPAALQSLVVEVCGRIKIYEVAGSGAIERELFHEMLYSWDAKQGLALPPEVPVRYTLPTNYYDGSNGQLPLPPTYEAHLTSMPGYTAHVSYQFTVQVLRAVRTIPLWRKRTRLRVPFLVQQHTRPSLAGPFGMRSVKTSAAPRTLFTFHVEARHSARRHIEAHVFLPSSQICCMRESIPFFVTLVASDDLLGPFTSYRPSTASFHPLAYPSSALNAMQHQFALINGASSPPLRICIQRTTSVNGLDTAGSYPAVDGHITSTRTIGHGVIHSTNKTLTSVTWSGVITVAPYISCGGFLTNALSVSDSIVVSIKPPDASRLQFMTLCETIPIRLTTESHGCPSAQPVAELRTQQ